MADALASGASSCKTVRVQIPFLAPKMGSDNISELFFLQFHKMK
jgi:hypothetical protein